jgi:DNA transformation protein
MDPDFIRELFQHFRPVEVRRMFGGAGIMADGITFGIVFDGTVYLKTDDETQPEFEREGSKPFVYPLMKKPRARKAPSSFWRLPERLYDDPEELAEWARRSFAISQRKKLKGAGKAIATKSRPRRPVVPKSAPKKARRVAPRRKR